MSHIFQKLEIKNPKLKKILTVIGTRPNYIKVTQFEKEFAKHPDLFEHRLLHTGQHFDKVMKDIFFEQLQLKKIDYALDVTHGTPGTQIGEIILKMDEVLRKWQPDLVIVVGDVNSTLAASLAANKANIKLAHVESGLRSFDLQMPEEYNRTITDFLADILFVTEKNGEKNLLREGKKPDQIFFVGNTMIDTLLAFDSQFDSWPIMKSLDVNEGEYVLMTMHRPSNVDDEQQLKKVWEVIQLIAEKFKVVFPIHPRTRKNISKFNLEQKFSSIKNLMLTGPHDYFSFQKLIKHASFVLTDSGGIQEETTFRKVPCLTLRENTERPSTVELGTNELIPFDLSVIGEKISSIENGTFKKGAIPPMWDGHATERIVEVLKEVL
ncbi:MAG TPA: UDP-N-acetylglucosamine 2-epimerase (non-hydrolyzing) [Chitinophagales bacterium]|nr:UDP-N-acetylglucosamine 2-epimerase (non-hydrolyzing) [Chitinophagales bacterium]